jgi:DNA-binding HxlR family transcriptional regulator
MRGQTEARWPGGYDVFRAECPSRQVLDTLSDKWVSLIIPALADAPLRYNELHRVVSGVSQKMLTQTLRTLEREGLLSRTVTPTAPVRVDYALTPLGRTLVPVLEAVERWAESHIDEIDEARVDFDARRAASA